MILGIMAAMPEEAETLKNEMQIENEITLGDRTYYRGLLYGIQTVIVFSRWGKVAASSTATTLITRFNVEHIIFTGVAGAVAPSLNIGDIVISKGLFQHDMDARPIFNRHEIPLIGVTLFEPSAENLQRATTSATHFVSRIHDIIPPKTLSEYINQPINVIPGIIATGDQFVSDAQNQDWPAFKEKILAVEMEGAAVAQVAHEHKVPYIVIRTISDKADHCASIDFQSFVTQIARYFSLGIVKNYIESLKEEKLSGNASAALSNKLQ